MSHDLAIALDDREAPSTGRPADAAMRTPGDATTHPLKAVVEGRVISGTYALKGRIVLVESQYGAAHAVIGLSEAPRLARAVLAGLFRRHRTHDVAP